MPRAPTARRRYFGVLIVSIVTEGSGRHHILSAVEKQPRAGVYTDKWGNAGIAGSIRFIARFAVRNEISMDAEETHNPGINGHNVLCCREATLGRTPVW